jgi:hypothetical protein
MFNRQNGFWPRFTFFTGLLTSLIFTLFLVNFSVQIITASVQHPEYAAGLWSRAWVVLLFYLFLILSGYILLSSFPAIRVTEQGVETKVLFFIRRIPWADVVTLTGARWPKDTQGLVFFHKTQNILVNFWKNAILYYPDQSHGFIAGIHEPVILFAIGLENRASLLSAIQERLPAQEVL